jgi:uracil-DNA glycosylase family 4
MTTTALPVIEVYSPRAHGARCDICPLKDHIVVPPSPSPLPPKVIFVGEAPGRKEEIQGRPFVGMTGQFLRGLCREVDLNFTEAALQNSALCRSEIDRENDEASVCCAPRLLRELAEFDPKIPIVTLGKSSTLSVLGVRSIMHARGFVWTAREIDPAPAWSKAKKAKLRKAPKWKELWLKAQIAEGRSKLAGRVILPTVHPAFVLRSDTWLPILKIDLDRIARWVSGDLTRAKLLENGPYVVVSKRDEIRRELRKLKPVISVDVETGASTPGGKNGADPLRNRLLCVGISDGKHTVVIWPWRKTFAPLVNTLFKRSTTIGMHNGYNFDQIVLKRYGVPFEPIEDKLEDTLIAHHTFASHMPQRLSHVASAFIDAGPWKTTFKQGSGGATEKGLPPEQLSGEELCRYNCLRGDTRVVLADGSTRKLQDIVNHRERPVVLAYDDARGIVKARVIGWSKTVAPDQKWVRIRVNGTEVRAQGLISTPEHEVRTQRGWVEAQHVRVGDHIPQAGRYLTSLERDALIGTLLGDSHMTFSPTRRKRRGTAETASVAGANVEESGLSQHKSECTRGFIVVDGQPEQPGPGAYPNAKPMLRYRTPMSVQVAALRLFVYDEKGRKRLLVSTLNSIGPVGFAWWFMDDGCLQKGRKRRYVGGTSGRKGARGVKHHLDNPERDSVTLATNCFSREDVDEAVKLFRLRFGPTNAGEDRVIRLGPLAARNFCRMIAPFVPPSMRYKFPRKASLYVGGCKSSVGDLSLGSWPKYSKRPLSEGAEAYYAKVVEAGPFDPPKRHSWQRTAAKTRYCLTVARTGNFFTAHGLVHNSADARIQAQVWLKMQADLEDEREVYAVDKANARLCRSMIIDGIGVDLERRKWLHEEIVKKQAVLLEKMRVLLRRPNFHPMQLSEVRKALFTTLRAPMSASDPTATGLPSTSQTTLERLKGNATRAGRFADLLLQWRGAVKIDGTYVYVKTQSIDKPSRKHPTVSRTHFNWRSYGAASGRYSCRAQSTPRAEHLKDKTIVLETRVREFYIARPGCKLVYFDLSQAELRFAAYLSADPAFMAACETGDVHTATAKKLFPAEAELIGADPKGAGKPFRDVEKNSIFGFIYDAAPETVFAFVRSKGLPVEMRDILYVHEMIRSTFYVYFRYVAQNKRIVDKVGFMRCCLSGRISWLGWHSGVPDVANRPIQGGIASLMNERLPKIARALPKGAVVVAQIHDAAILEVPDRHVERVSALVKATWEEPVVIPANGWGTSTRVEDGARAFVMPIDLKVGERWSSFG